MARGNLRKVRSCGRRAENLALNRFGNNSESGLCRIGFRQIGFSPPLRACCSPSLSRPHSRARGTKTNSSAAPCSPTRSHGTRQYRRQPDHLRSPEGRHAARRRAMVRRQRQGIIRSQQQPRLVVASARDQNHAPRRAYSARHSSRRNRPEHPGDAHLLLLSLSDRAAAPGQEKVRSDGARRVCCG